MKADTRHQLKTNELAEALLKVRLWFDKNWRNVAVVVGSAVVLLVAVNIWRWSRASAVDAAWTRLFEIETTGDSDPADAVQRFRDLASSSGDPVVAVLAHYRAGCALLNYANRDAAKSPQLLEEAVASLKRVVDNPAAPPTIAAAANFALAGAYENKRDFASAKAAYDAILKESRFDGTPYQNLAGMRSAEIDELQKTVVRFEPGRPVPASAPALAPPADAAATPAVDAVPAAAASESPATQPADSPADSSPQQSPPHSDPAPQDPPPPNPNP